VAGHGVFRLSLSLEPVKADGSPQPIHSFYGRVAPADRSAGAPTDPDVPN
jgi:hypothetical protein